MTKGRSDGPVPLPRQPGENEALWDREPRGRPFEYRSATERLREIWEETWIERPTARQIREDISLNIATETPRAGRGLFLVAAAHAGVTTLVQDLAEEHRQNFGREIARAAMPVSIDLRDLYVEMRRAIGLGTIVGTPLDNMAIDFFRELETGRVSAIVVDGMEHMVHVAPRRRMIMLEHLYHIGQCGNVVMVFAMPRRLLEQVDRIYNGGIDPRGKLAAWGRELHEFHLGPFVVDEEYIDILDIWERRLPLKKASNLTGRDLALHVYGLCDGNYGRLASVLRGAAAEAITSGREQISIELLDEMGFQPPVRFSGFRF